VIVLLRQLGLFFKEFSFPYASYKFLLELRKDIFEKIITSQPLFLIKKDLGDIINISDAR
jgi:hypothetical protein